MLEDSNRLSLNEFTKNLKSENSSFCYRFKTVWFYIKLTLSLKSKKLITHRTIGIFVVLFYSACYASLQKHSVFDFLTNLLKNLTKSIIYFRNEVLLKSINLPVCRQCNRDPTWIDQLDYLYRKCNFRLASHSPTTHHW